MIKATSCGCGQTPIQARVESWADCWVPTNRHGSKARSIFEDQFRTMLSEVFDEIQRRADEMHGPAGTGCGCYAAMTQVRSELCGERKTK